jgi:hypothetical protein
MPEHRPLERQAEQVRKVGVGHKIVVGVGLEVLHGAEAQPVAR